MAASWWLQASGAIQISDAYSVGLLNARSAPPAPAPRAARARHDRRGGGCAAVHALGGLAAARGARARGGRAPARAGRARRPAHRRRAGARGPRRGAARPGRPRGGRAGRGRGQRGGAGEDRHVPVGSAAPGRPGHARAARGTRRACAASSWRPSPSRRCPRSRWATWTSSWPTSGSTSRTRGRPVCTAHDLHRDLVRVVLPEGHPAARRHQRAVPLAELAGEVWTTGHRGTAWEEMTQRNCRQLGGFDPDIRHRTNDAVGEPRARGRGPGRDAPARPRRRGRPSRCGGARHRGRARAPDHLRGDPHSGRPAVPPSRRCSAPSGPPRPGSADLRGCRHSALSSCSA